MNYYEARQRKSDGRWDFTVMNNGNVRSTGYCTPWERIEAARRRAAEMGINPNAHRDHLIDQHKHHFHGDGHATPEEAAECYKRYVLDLRTSYHCGGNATTMHVCQHEGCDEITSLGALVDQRLFWLCDAHRNREGLELLFNPPFKIVSSY